MRHLAVCATLYALAASSALATPQETAVFTNLNSNGVLNSPVNIVDTRNLAGGYALGRIDITGTLTRVNVNTWQTDSRILITAPSGATAVVQPFTSGSTYTTLNVSTSVFFAAAVTPAGTWTFRFFENVDDGGTASIDARWNITVTFTDEPPAPPIATDLGALSAPGSAVQTYSQGATQVRWFRFSLPCGVRAVRGQYLDIDTAGSTIAASPGLLQFPNDTQLALFDGSGRLLAQDDDDGQGFLAQLTFARGSGTVIPAGSDASSWNGVDGTLPPGTYYLAVGAYRITVGPDRWLASPTSTQTGTIMLGLRTNVMPPPCPCPADFEGSGQVSVQDIFSFLEAWFGGSIEADFNGDGTLSVQDIFDLLAAYFAGCN